MRHFKVVILVKQLGALHCDSDVEPDDECLRSFLCTIHSFEGSFDKINKIIHHVVMIGTTSESNFEVNVSIDYASKIVL